MPGSSISIFRVLGVFGAFLMLLIWLGPTLTGIGKAIKTGEWSSVLKDSGGRLFAIEGILHEETNYLIDETNDDQVYTKVFHFAHALTLLFMLFFLAFMLFKFGNYLLGLRAFSPSTDVFLIIGIILVFFLIEFIYAWKVLGTIIIPMKDGTFYFLKNIPGILNSFIS